MFSTKSGAMAVETRFYNCKDLFNSIQEPVFINCIAESGTQINKHDGVTAGRSPIKTAAYTR
jgi:hypothetical protein